MKNVGIEFEEISFAGFGEYDRFVKWIEEKVAQGKVEELEQIGKNDFRPIVQSLLKYRRYFRMKGDQQVWLLCDYDGSANACFLKIDPNILY